jgi:uncharacterized protein (TIGR03437 family)
MARPVDRFPTVRGRFRYLPGRSRETAFEQVPSAAVGLHRTAVQFFIMVMRNSEKDRLARSIADRHADFEAALPLFGTTYVAATHTDYSLLGPTSLGPGFTPARPGETVVLYAFGFGLPTTALVNGASTQSGSLPALPQIQIGGAPAPVSFAGVISPGLYQFNVTIPAAAANGDNAVICTYAGLSTPVGDLISVQSGGEQQNLRSSARAVASPQIH